MAISAEIQEQTVKEVVRAIALIDTEQSTHLLREALDQGVVDVDQVTDLIVQGFQIRSAVLANKTGDQRYTRWASGQEEFVSYYLNRENVRDIIEGQEVCISDQGHP